VFVDLQLVKRQAIYGFDMMSAHDRSTSMAMMALRWNIAPRNYDF
jgi:hypothetical protein